MERRKRLVGDLAASLQGAVTLESWVMALYPRAWCRVAIFGGGLGVLLSSMAVSISLTAAWDSSHACLMEATQDATAPSCWRRGWIACGRLACAAWASVLRHFDVEPDEGKITAELSKARGTRPPRPTGQAIVNADDLAPKLAAAGPPYDTMLATA